MFDIAASAFRIGNAIHATVSARLPDSCHKAHITDVYPGGNIVYVKDPGMAQIFVAVTKSPGPCSEAIEEWYDTVQILDSYSGYKRLQVIATFGEERFKTETQIQVREQAEGTHVSSD